jgi:hypothetical protein
MKEFFFSDLLCYNCIRFKCYPTKILFIVDRYAKCFQMSVNCFTTLGVRAKT